MACGTFVSNRTAVTIHTGRYFKHNKSTLLNQPFQRHKREPHYPLSTHWPRDTEGVGAARKELLKLAHEGTWQSITFQTLESISSIATKAAKGMLLLLLTLHSVVCVTAGILNRIEC